MAECLKRTKAVALAAAVVATALLMPSLGNAASVYYLLHQSDGYGNTGPNDVIGPQSSPINYDFNAATSPANTGEVHATMNQGSIGIYARATNNGGYSPQRQEVTAQYTFDVIFGSAGTAPVDVIMNLDFSGDVSPTYIYSTISVVAGLTLAPSSGDYRESLTEPTIRDGMLAGFIADGSDQTISTNPFSVAVNVPVSLTLQLITVQTYGTNSPTIDFAHTLSLATGIDVFTILGTDPITVNSEDAGIDDNRFAVAAVPVPAALPLFFSGLAGLGFAGWRRKRATS